MTTKLLIVIDPKRTDQPALDRALEIARLIDISMHIVVFSNKNAEDSLTLSVDPALTRGFENDHDRVRQVWLDQLAGPIREEGLKVTTEVRLFNRLYEAIIQVALEEDADIVYKPIRRHTVLQRALFNSTDWNLIRLCPLPLLLVSDSRPVKGRDIIAAVDLSSEDDDHTELNRLLMSQAVMISRLIQSQVKVVNASPQGSGGLNYPASESADQKDIDDAYRAKALALADKFNLSSEQVIIKEGSAEKVVNDLARSTNAAVIILGTVARSGLAGLFIGNTAERVLEDSNSDVLVVKQADFTTPIQIDPLQDRASQQ
ncbi:MAG: universal stress protein [Pseudomonadales bacterium]|jgi:universal stress protein E|nr:universal stress protein [Pseudomonadales bacterium]MDP7358114.1 universal stress protein [Pseudomonadales bacterium]HJN49483.1 universal stress protein [Pseudomonadales bacterium]|tara:strand:- start:461 stop:1408 length:948 start_codon:yes stop_codon:yes gene_type:complete